ncbi:MAG: cell envelope biogenesis protein TolA [Sphingobium sp.]
MERAEKIGFGVASAGHVLLFGILSLGLFARPQPLKLNNPPMDVSIVDKVALESAAPQVATQPPPAAHAPEQGPAEEAKAEPETPAPQPEPTPRPVPKVEAPAPVPKPAPRKPAPEKPVPAKATPKKAQPTKATPPKTATAKGSGQRNKGPLLGPDFLKGIATESPSPSPKPAAPSGAKMSSVAARALNDEISRQIYPRLRLPSGADVEKLVALLEVRLDRSGAVIGTPQVIDVTGVTDSNQPQVNLYKERAVQAVMQASPFQNLPPQYYDQWKWLKPLSVYARKAQ